MWLILGCMSLLHLLYPVRLEKKLRPTMSARSIREFCFAGLWHLSIIYESGTKIKEDAAWGTNEQANMKFVSCWHPTGSSAVGIVLDFHFDGSVLLMKGSAEQSPEAAPAAQQSPLNGPSSYMNARIHIYKCVCVYIYVYGVSMDN